MQIKRWRIKGGELGRRRAYLSIAVGEHRRRMSCMFGSRRSRKSLVKEVTPRIKLARNVSSFLQWYYSHRKYWRGTRSESSAWDFLHSWTTLFTTAPDSTEAFVRVAHVIHLGKPTVKFLWTVTACSCWQVSELTWPPQLEVWCGLYCVLRLAFIYANITHVVSYRCPSKALLFFLIFIFLLSL